MEQRSFRRVVPKILAVLLVLLCVVPVPVLALTFLGSWQYFEQRSGTQLPPSHNHNSADFTNGGTLSIDMRSFTTATDGKLTVTATRDFSLFRSELVSVSHAFGSLLSNGGISVTMTIVPIGGTDVFGFPPFSGNAPVGPPMSFGTNTNKSVVLPTGNYRVSLTIIYRTGTVGTPGGQWNNNSPHNFNFFGV